MIAIATGKFSISIISRFIFSQNSLTTENLYKDLLNYNLHPKGIFIKNKNSLYALYVNDYSNRIILGEVNIMNYSFLLKQTLPAMYSSSVI
jgi:hypothetical protein